jgi:hypothetical protein
VPKEEPPPVCRLFFVLPEGKFVVARQNLQKKVKKLLQLLQDGHTVL